MARLRYNGIYGRIITSVAQSSTTLTLEAPLTHGGNNPVPSLGGTDYFSLSVIGDLGQLIEIVHVTGYISGASTVTVLRGQEGTTSSPLSAGLALVQAPTVEDFSLLRMNDVAQFTPQSGQALVWNSGISK